LPREGGGRIVACVGLKTWKSGRAAAKAQRRSERAIRAERESRYTADRRAARTAAEARHGSIFAGHPGTHIGNGG
jgi:hypothetical protein